MFDAQGTATPIGAMTGTDIWGVGKSGQQYYKITFLSLIGNGLCSSAGSTFTISSECCPGYSIFLQYGEDCDQEFHEKIYYGGPLEDCTNKRREILSGEFKVSDCKDKQGAGGKIDAQFSTRLKMEDGTLRNIEGSLKEVPISWNPIGR